MLFNLGVGAEAKPHSSHVMTTVASTLKQISGWWAINLLDQNDEATAPHESKKISGGPRALIAFSSHIYPLRYCLSCLVIHFLISWIQFTVIFQRSTDRTLQVRVLLLPLVFSRGRYCVFALPHVVATECLLTNMQCLSGAAWLLLPWSGALLREAASFCCTSGSQVYSHVLVSCEDHILCASSQEELNKLFLRRRSSTCVFNVLKESRLSRQNKLVSGYDFTRKMSLYKSPFQNSGSHFFHTNTDLIFCTFIKHFNSVTLFHIVVPQKLKVNATSDPRVQAADASQHQLFGGGRVKQTFMAELP